MRVILPAHKLNYMINVEKIIAAPGIFDFHREDVKGLSFEDIAGKKKVVALPLQLHFSSDKQNIWNLLQRLVQKFQ